MKTKNKLALVLSILFCLQIYAQTEDFQYKRTIETTSETWHRINLPEDALLNFNRDFSDVRIFGTTEKNEIIEVPYILKKGSSEFSLVEIPFKTLNTSNKNGTYFYTFQVSEKKEINQIILSFEQENFDWKLDLEGSNDQSEWFSILENYRILSIKNKHTNYQFTQIDLPNSDYAFYRLKINSDEKPKLQKASIFDKKKTDGSFTISKIKSIKKTIDPKKKQSIIEIELENSVPVSSLKINATNAFDYYRPMKIETLLDSTKVESGWHFNYNFASQETLSSLSTKEFPIQNQLTKKIKITIENQNNQPLDIDKIEIKNSVYSLVARFTEKADYALFYGNKKAEKPFYDIENFQDNIPKNLSAITVLKEESNPDFKVKTNTPLFENKLWLWMLMGIIIAVLGYFSLRMLKD